MVEVPDTYLKGRKPEDFCAMRVRGDSMYPDFCDGDIVPVLKQNTMNHSGERGHRPGKMPYYRYPARTDTRVLNIKITPTGCNR